MMNIVVPTIKSVMSKVYNWFNKTDMVTPDKLEVVSATYFVHRDEDEKPKVRKKKLTRMRVIKRTKEVNNGL